jgi:YceI-like domain
MRRAKGTIDVFTFKEGLLARAAHDLQLRFEQFQITLDGENVRAEFALTNLKLVGPVEGGVVHPEQYDAGKRADVERAMNQEILHTEQNPSAVFTGRVLPSGEGFSADGALQLSGRSVPLAFDVRKQGGEYRVDLEIQPSRWGIPQYKAMLGAIRLKDLVRIECRLTDA